MRKARLQICCPPPPSSLSSTCTSPARAEKPRGQRRAARRHAQRRAVLSRRSRHSAVSSCIHCHPVRHPALRPLTAKWMDYIPWPSGSFGGVSPRSSLRVKGPSRGPAPNPPPPYTAVTEPSVCRESLGTDPALFTSSPQRRSPPTELASAPCRIARRRARGPVPQSASSGSEAGLPRPPAHTAPVQARQSICSRSLPAAEHARIRPDSDPERPGRGGRTSVARPSSS